MNCLKSNIDFLDPETCDFTVQNANHYFSDQYSVILALSIGDKGCHNDKSYLCKLFQLA